MSWILTLSPCIAGWGRLWWSCTGDMHPRPARTSRSWPEEATTPTQSFTVSSKNSWYREETQQGQVGSSHTLYWISTQGQVGSSHTLYWISTQGTGCSYVFVFFLSIFHASRLWRFSVKQICHFGTNYRSDSVHWVQCNLCSQLNMLKCEMCLQASIQFIT